MSTAVTTQPTVSAPVPVVSPPLHRITVDEYERIAAVGALDEPARIELIDGYMVDKMPKNPEHSYTTKQVLKALESRLPAGWTSRKEEPVRIPAYDEPEPDVAIVQGSDADYEHRNPSADDVALLVEVSESSLSFDRRLKLSAYAKARIPVYWIVNLVDRQVEVYTRPTKTGYTSHKDYGAGEQVPVTIGGQSLPPIAVDDLLPRTPPSSGRRHTAGGTQRRRPRPRREPARPRGN
jgi:Uma2 family endonuclease